MRQTIIDYITIMKWRENENKTLNLRKYII